MKRSKIKTPPILIKMAEPTIITGFMSMVQLTAEEIVYLRSELTKKKDHMYILVLIIGN